MIFTESTTAAFFDDIDHAIPKNLSGRGDILWNLVPVNRSINRNKGDVASSEVLQCANKPEFRELFAPGPASLASFQLMNEKQQWDAVKAIMLQVKDWPEDVQQAFYKLHMLLYFPAAYKMLETFLKP